MYRNRAGYLLPFKLGKYNDYIPSNVFFGSDSQIVRLEFNVLKSGIVLLY